MTCRTAVRAAWALLVLTALAAAVAVPARLPLAEAVLAAVLVGHAAARHARTARPVVSPAVPAPAVEPAG